MVDIIVPTSPGSTDPSPAPEKFWNIIPDDLRKTIDPADFPITSANYVSLTYTPDRQVWAPGHQAVDPAIDLNQIADNFESVIQSALPANLFQINPDVLLDNSTKSTQSSEVSEHFLFDSLNSNPITHNVSTFTPDSVISDSNTAQFPSLFPLISSATTGANQNLFCDADDEDNLIEISSADATQSGGIRAWGGNDQILGSDNDDVAYGNAGNDKMFGAAGNDLLLGGEGDDSLYGGDGDDLLVGGKGDDYLAGGLGNNVLLGGEGIDVLIGNVGKDILLGHGDGDFLMGAAGPDEFILTGNSLRGDTLMNDSAYAYRILDFTPSNNPTDGDIIKIVDYLGIPGREQISFAPVDVNLDGQTDTAIISSDRVVGVVMGINPEQLSSFKSSIFMVGPQDTTLS